MPRIKKGSKRNNGADKLDKRFVEDGEGLIITPPKKKSKKK